MQLSGKFGRFVFDGELSLLYLLNPGNFQPFYISVG